MSKPKIVLKKLKALDKIWHPESSLVFKSLDDKKVIGRYTDNEFISLDEVALQLCLDWNFSYDPDLVEEASEVDEKSNTDDQESEPEDSNTVEPEPTVETKVEHDPPIETKVEQVEPESSVEEVEQVEPEPPHVEMKENVHEWSRRLVGLDKSDKKEENLVDEFKTTIERINSLYYNKVYEYEELEKKYNDLVIELKETKVTLSDIRNKFENIKKFLQ